jgi:hypothetical protein
MAAPETRDIKEEVRQKYDQDTMQAASGASSCCSTTGTRTGSSCCDPITSNLYDASQIGQIPEEALLASLGCGDPTALGNLNPGETVLDLGSGGGIAFPTGRRPAVDRIAPSVLPWRCCPALSRILPKLNISHSMCCTQF